MHILKSVSVPLDRETPQCDLVNMEYKRRNNVDKCFCAKSSRDDTQMIEKAHREMHHRYILAQEFTLLFCHQSKLKLESGIVR